VADSRSIALYSSAAIPDYSIQDVSTGSSLSLKFERLATDEVIRSR
jgi:hypothetical protein